MRHAFVPMSNGSDRCARCLRHLDCAPHLPIAPLTTLRESIRLARRSTTIESRRLSEDRYGVEWSVRAVSRAAR